MNAYQPGAPPVRRSSEVLAVYKMLWTVARLDKDHARETNGVGFSKFDSEDGHWLAVKARECGLTEEELRFAVRMLRKYHRQVDPELYRMVYPERKRCSLLPTP